MIGWTLGRYLSGRFLLTIAAVFLMISGMIYVVDFVEMLRRAANIPDATAGFIAYLSLLRVPWVSEQILPFCVLSGTMATFLLLSRKSELLIARAVGVSAWGFLAPPVAIAAAAGIASFAVLDPVFVLMKQRADLMETHLFSRNGRQNEEASLWIRQKSVDGEAFIRALEASPDGTRLTAPAAFVYDPDGAFAQKVEARAGTLLPGVWQFDDARITAHGEESFSAGTFLLASGLSGKEVLQGAITPDSVPFWDLPAARDAAENAGLDGTGFWLRFHLLLARPLLFVAMVLIAATFSLRFFRFGGIGKMVFGGMGAGFVLYGAAKFAGDLGGAGLINPVIAAWSPAVVASLLGMFVLLNQEDG